MIPRLLALAAVASLFGLTLRADPPVEGPQGRVRVIDADTFDIGEARVRLHGVDAPERHQTCLDAEGVEWACGEWAIERARARWEGRQATCETLDIDRYGREVARCKVGGEDMGAILVAGGMALAYREYSDDYVVQESHAQGALAGIWRGEFREPSDFRRDPQGPVSEVVVLSAPGACEIKGNISGNGRIYHLPGGRHYAATEIDEARGERWFCAVEEAEAAGWRAPRD